MAYGARTLNITGGAYLKPFSVTCEAMSKNKKQTKKKNELQKVATTVLFNFPNPVIRLGVLETTWLLLVWES